MPAQNIIYGLVDPRTLLVRYVGKSAKGMLRPREHRRQLHREDTYKARWLKSLLALGLDYTIVVLEEIASADLLADAEVWRIAYGRASGWPLTNLTDGGDGTAGRTVSAATKVKLTAAMSAPEVRGRISAAVMEHWRTRPRTVSAETRAKLAEAGRGRRRPGGTRRPPSPETRAKISTTLRGRIVSEDTRAKTSQAITTWWQNRIT